ncbi:DUF922 domain-containing protein [Vibrio parahaemolyticus]|nr:DUF922 domain-containing protein [Vibrio parahaemolyticus]EGR0930250.1 DUF922 domain-containing protein [Vibrio parahaemolyticus]EGR3234388.1 hypothetical protein [Vibrio parahaemolyticus]EJG0180001.1 DUF922 domain-containing protein [Vibrio parahaemolyticus]EJM9301201.1 DUF922 domain-containing protein [Vibrio parahaemolyticus]
MKKIAFVILCLSLSGYTYSNAELGFPFHKKFEIYKVVGDRVDDIENSFDESRPTFLKENGFDGYTAWKYDFHTDDDTCEIYNFSLRVTYTLPQIEMSTVSPESTEEFHSYIEKLYRHEQVHCALTVKSMREIFLAFKSGQNGDCSKANQRTIDLESELEENHDLFDVYTSHGEIELGESPFGEERYLKVCEIPYEPISPRI